MGELFQEAQSLSNQDQQLVEAYEQIGLPVDALPYSEGFKNLFKTLRGKGDNRTRRDIIKRLWNLRKAGRLPRVGRTSAPVIPLSSTEEELLSDLIPLYAGTVGQRDKLVYTEEFKHLVKEFNRKTGRNLTNNDIWLLVSRVAK